MPRFRLGLAVLIGLLSLIGPARADEPILLQYKLTRGNALIYKTGLEIKQSQTVNSMKFESTVTQDVVVSRTVDEIGEDGKATLKTKAERRKVKIDGGPAGNYEFDSKSTERDNSSTIGAAATPLFERLTGSEYQVEVNPRGQVVDVKGYAELIADVIKDNPLGAQFAGGNGGNAAAKLTEQESFIILSDKPVKPGDQWESPFELDLPGMGKAKGKVTYVYEGNDKVGERQTARIGVTTDLTFELSLEAGGAKVTGTISTSKSSGTAQFDPESGRVLSSKRSLSTTGQLTVEAGGKTFTVDTQQDQTTASELLDKLPE